MENVCFNNCRDSIVKDQNEFELNKFRGLENFSLELRDNFLFEGNISNECDFYLCEHVGVPASVYCEKVGINYFNSLDMYEDVSRYIEENKHLIEDDVYNYIKNAVDINSFKIFVGNYLSCHSDLLKEAKYFVDIAKDDARFMGFAVDYVHNVFVAVAYRYLWSCIFGSQRSYFHTFKN